MSCGEDDGPFQGGALTRQVNVQSKAVFSYAMTVMDKILGWHDEEKWVGSNFAACMGIHTKLSLSERRVLLQKCRSNLKRRILSVMLCVNWVCAGNFEGHEWVSESTIAEQ